MAAKVTVMMMLVCMVVAAPYAEAMTCGQIVSSLGPCFPYLRSGGKVPPSCCSAVKSTNSAIKGTPARQAACSCLKGVAGSGGFNPSLIANLPGQCGVNLGYSISVSIDCSKVR